MRLAYLIIAHHLPEQLAQMLYSIQHPDNIYLVIPDSKGLTGHEPALQALTRRHSNVIMARPRDVRWASWSLMQAKLDGIAQLLARPEPWDMLVCLSGQDFPLKSQQQIREFLIPHRERNFVPMVDPVKTWGDPYARVQRIRLEPPFMKHGWNVPRVRRDRWKRHLGHSRYVGGRPYMVLNRAFCQHLMKSPQLPQWVSALRYGYRPEEVLIHSFISNSPFAESVINEMLHEEDWSGGGSHPRVFTMADQAQLMQSERLFARKFDHRVDDGVLQMLQQKVQA